MASCFEAMQRPSDEHLLGKMRASNLAALSTDIRMGRPISPSGMHEVALCASPSTSHPVQLGYTSLPQESLLPTHNTRSPTLRTSPPPKQPQLLLTINTHRQLPSPLTGPSSKTAQVLLQREGPTSISVDPNAPSPSLLWSHLQTSTPEVQQQQPQPQPASQSSALSDAMTLNLAEDRAGAGAAAATLAITKAELDQLMLLPSITSQSPSGELGTTQATGLGAPATSATIPSVPITGYHLLEQQPTHLSMESSSSSVSSQGIYMSRSSSSGLSPNVYTAIQPTGSLSVVALSEALPHTTYYLQPPGLQEQLQQQVKQQQLRIEQQWQENQLLQHQVQQLQQQVQQPMHEHLYVGSLQCPVTVADDMVYMLSPQPFPAATVIPPGLDMPGLHQAYNKNMDAISFPSAAPSILGLDTAGLPHTVAVVQANNSLPVLPQAHPMVATGGATGAGSASVGHTPPGLGKPSASAAALAANNWPFAPAASSCRLFIGNLGWWVDEQLLMEHFGKCGQVVDIQVMWNTKMYSRGRKVNREFAFISYSTPVEAAHAVRCLHGCNIPDLQKDATGITVEYESGSLLKGQKMRRP